MKVLIVHPRMYLYGGAELLIVRLANYLTGIGIENTLLTTQILPEIKKDLLNTSIIDLSKSGGNVKIGSFTPFKLTSLLFKGIRKHASSYDLINIHNYPSELAVVGCPRPVVWMCNEPLNVAVDSRLTNTSTLDPKRLFYSGLLSLDRMVVRKFIDKAVVADEANKLRFESIFGYEPALINYGIDYDYFSANVRPLSKPDPSSFTILHVGMLTSLKNQLESLRTLRSIGDRIKGVKLVLAGQGEKGYLEEINKYIKDNNLSAQVQITGHVDRAELRELYRSSDVLLHPIKPQGGWLAPFEAICAGLPIITSKEMTAASIIKNNHLGIVTSNYAQAVLDLYGKLKEHQALSKQRANWVKENLSWDNFGEKMVALFGQALNEHDLKS